MERKPALRMVLQAMYITVALLTVVFFAQSDLSHTLFSSYTILQGHVFDFYDFNQPTMVGNDYLILLYTVIALWMSPIYFFGLTTPADHYHLLMANPVELMWAKLGLLGLLIVLAFLVRRVAERYFATDRGSNPHWLVVTSPFAILPVLVMGQYDIIGLVLVLLGFEAWLSKRYLPFVAYFAIALSFKYLAVAIFVPLVLIGARSIRQALGWIALAMIPVGLQIGIGLTNAAFRSNAAAQPVKLLLPDFDSPISIAMRVIALLLACAIAVWLIGRKYESDSNQRDFAVLAVVASLTVFFVVVRWNPQWLIYAVPFWAFLTLQTKHVRSLMFIDALGFIGLVWMLANPWANNVDDSMALRGALSSLLPDRVLRLNDFFTPDLLMVGVILVHLAIVAPPAIRLWELYRYRATGNSAQLRSRIGGAWLLRPLSFVVAFLIPVALCYFLPATAASAISKSVELNSLERLGFGQMHHAKLVTRPGESVEETVLVQSAHIRAVTVDISTFGKRLDGSIELVLSNRHQVIAKSYASLDHNKDSSFPGFSGWLAINFKFKETATVVNEELTLSFKNSTKAPIGIWVDDVRPEEAEIKLPSGESASGSIVMTFLEAKEERLGN